MLIRAMIKALFWEDFSQIRSGRESSLKGYKFYVRSLDHGLICPLLRSHELRF